MYIQIIKKNPTDKQNKNPYDNSFRDSKKIDSFLIFLGRHEHRIMWLIGFIFGFLFCYILAKPH